MALREFGSVVLPKREEVVVGMQGYCALLWRADSEASHLVPWLQDPTAGEPGAASSLRAFQPIVEAFEHAVSHMHTGWGVQGYLQDQRRFNVIRTLSLHLMKQHNCSELSLVCSLDDAIL